MPRLDSFSEVLFVFFPFCNINIVGVSATKELSAEKIPAKEGGTNVPRLARIPEPKIQDS